MEFKLFSKLASLEGIELYMLLGGLVVLGLLIWVVTATAKRAKAQAVAAPEAIAGKQSRAQVLVYGALSITLAFVLSYFIKPLLPAIFKGLERMVGATVSAYERVIGAKQ